MTTALNVVHVAMSQVGVHEGRGITAAGRIIPGPPWNNYQLYSPETPGLEWSQAEAWCATFVSWVALKAGAAALYPRTASVAAARDWWRARGRLDHNPRVGDQVIFGVNGDAHTALVVGLTATQIITVEGNSNNNGSPQGDGVYHEVHDRNSSWIYGYGHPNFPRPAVVRPVPPTAKPLPTVSLTATRRAALHHWRLSSVVRWRQVLRVRRALRAEGFPRDYAGWLKHLGYHANTHLMIPNLDDLTKLGARHGFRVTP